MRVGEVAKFTLRSDYAYGPKGSPPTIPPDATLVFEVELISISEQSPRKKIIKEGEGVESPLGDCDVILSYEMYHDEKLIEKKEKFKFIYEDGQVIDGISKVLRNMKKGEICEAALKPMFAFGQKGSKELGVPSNATLKVKLELHDFEVMKMTYEMDKIELLEFAKKHKGLGNEFIKQKKYDLCFKRYKCAIDAIAKEDNFDNDQLKEKKDLLRDCALNMALASLSLKDVKNTKKYSEEALKYDPKNIKALFRKASAFVLEEDFEEAKNIFKKALEYDPNNVDVKKQIEKVNGLIKKQNEKDKARYASLFK
jgi:FK506-binding protein 4/5